jgi:hypothetical protein
VVQQKDVEADRLVIRRHAEPLADLVGQPFSDSLHEDLQVQFRECGQVAFRVALFALACGDRVPVGLQEQAVNARPAVDQRPEVLVRIVLAEQVQREPRGFDSGGVVEQRLRWHGGHELRSRREDRLDVGITVAEELVNKVVAGQFVGTEG